MSSIMISCESPLNDDGVFLKLATEEAYARWGQREESLLAAKAAAALFAAESTKCGSIDAELNALEEAEKAAAMANSKDNGFWAIPMDQSWGDMVPESENKNKSNGKEIGWQIDWSQESDAINGWQVPSLRLRKDIWENFPVSLLPVNDCDGTDRYAIVWHKRNFDAWRSERTQSQAEALDYEDYCHIRLMYALSLNTARYAVEEPRNSEQICVIAMVHADDASSASTQKSKSVEVDGWTSVSRSSASEASSVTTTSSSASSSPSGPSGPIRSLKGIAAAFPVCWEQSGNVLGLKFHNKKLRETGESASVVKARLFAALQQSPAGVFAPAPKGSAAEVLCLFTLNK